MTDCQPAIMSQLNVSQALRGGPAAPEVKELMCQFEFDPLLGVNSLPPYFSLSNSIPGNKSPRITDFS